MQCKFMLQDSTADFTDNSSCLSRWSSRDTNCVFTWHCNNTPSASLPPTLLHLPPGKMHYTTRRDTLWSLKKLFHQNHLPFIVWFSALLVVPWLLGNGILLFLMESNHFFNKQTCRSLYWRKLSACILKVFIIKLVCRAILTINSISRCDMCQPFLEQLRLSTPSPCSLPLVSTAIQPFLLFQQNQLQLLSSLTVLQLVAAAPFPQCPKEELNCWVPK